MVKEWDADTCSGDDWVEAREHFEPQTAPNPLGLQKRPLPPWRTMAALPPTGTLQGPPKGQAPWQCLPLGLHPPPLPTKDHV